MDESKAEAVEKAILDAVPHVRAIVRMVAGGQVADAASDSVFVPAANYLMGVVSERTSELKAERDDSWKNGNEAIIGWAKDKSEMIRMAVEIAKLKAVVDAVPKLLERIEGVAEFYYDLDQSPDGATPAWDLLKLAMDKIRATTGASHE